MFPFELFGVHHQRCNRLANLRLGSQAWVVEDCWSAFHVPVVGARNQLFLFLFPFLLYWINASCFFICHCFVFIIIVLSADNGDTGVPILFFMLPVKHNSSLGLLFCFLCLFLSFLISFFLFICSHGSHRWGVGAEGSSESKDSSLQSCKAACWVRLWIQQNIREYANVGSCQTRGDLKSEESMRNIKLCKAIWREQKRGSSRVARMARSAVFPGQSGEEKRFISNLKWHCLVWDYLNSFLHGPRALLLRWAVFVCGSLPQINSPLGLLSFAAVHGGQWTLRSCQLSLRSLLGEPPTGQIVPKWRAEMACWFAAAAQLLSPRAPRFTNRNANKILRRLQVADMSLPVCEEVTYLSVSFFLCRRPGAWPAMTKNLVWATPFQT